MERVWGLCNRVYHTNVFRTGIISIASESLFSFFWSLARWNDRYDVHQYSGYIAGHATEWPTRPRSVRSIVIVGKHCIVDAKYVSTNFRVTSLAHKCFLRITNCKGRHNCKGGDFYRRGGATTDKRIIDCKIHDQYVYPRIISTPLKELVQHSMHNAYFWYCNICSPNSFESYRTHVQSVQTASTKRCFRASCRTQLERQ